MDYVMGNKILFAKVIAMFALSGLADIAATQTIDYTYDVLGRVTFVNDSVNGNRDYDYDAAGNRKRVDVGNSLDSDNKPVPPPKPINLFVFPGPLVGGTYESNWDPVTGASYYLLTTANTSTPFEIPASDVVKPFRIPRPGLPSFVQACNNDVGCGAGATFGPPNATPTPVPTPTPAPTPTPVPTPTPPPPPALPSGLSRSAGTVAPGNLWDASWKVVPLATYYVYTAPSTSGGGANTSYTIDATVVYSITPTGSTFTTPGATITVRRPNKPSSVKACNANGCSADVAFY